MWCKTVLLWCPGPYLAGWHKAAVIPARSCWQQQNLPGINQHLVIAFQSWAPLRKWGWWQRRCWGPKTASRVALGGKQLLKQFSALRKPRGGFTTHVIMWLVLSGRENLCRGRSPGVPQGKGREHRGWRNAVLGGLCGSLLLFWVSYRSVRGKGQTRTQ